MTYPLYKTGVLNNSGLKSTSGRKKELFIEPVIESIIHTCSYSSIDSTSGLACHSWQGNVWIEFLTSNKDMCQILEDIYNEIFSALKIW